jgi:hypothetical protein
MAWPDRRHDAASEAGRRRRRQTGHEPVGTYKTYNIQIPIHRGRPRRTGKMRRSILWLLSAPKGKAAGRRVDN